jgi:hypothetical protein
VVAGGCGPIRRHRRYLSPLTLPPCLSHSSTPKSQHRKGCFHFIDCSKVFLFIMSIPQLIFMKCVHCTGWIDSLFQFSQSTFE